MQESLRSQFPQETTFITLAILTILPIAHNSLLLCNSQNVLNPSKSIIRPNLDLRVRVLSRTQVQLTCVHKISHQVAEREERGRRLATLRKISRVRVLSRTQVQITCVHKISYQVAEREERGRRLATLRKISRILAAFMRLREAFLHIRMSGNTISGVLSLRVWSGSARLLLNRFRLYMEL